MSGCFNCGSPDHWRDSCPIAIRADSHAEHMGRIASFIDRWVDGSITLEAKRLAIGAENMQWYGPECPAKLRWPMF